MTGLVVHASRAYRYLSSALASMAKFHGFAVFFKLLATLEARNGEKSLTSRLNPSQSARLFHLQRTVKGSLDGRT